jgi:hypothetical protein
LIAKAHDDDTRQEFANATAVANLAVSGGLTPPSCSASCHFAQFDFQGVERPRHDVELFRQHARAKDDKRKARPRHEAKDNSHDEQYYAHKDCEPTSQKGFAGPGRQAPFELSAESVPGLAVAKVVPPSFQSAEHVGGKFFQCDANHKVGTSGSLFGKKPV